MDMFLRFDRKLDANAGGTPDKPKAESPVFIATDVRRTQTSAESAAETGAVYGPSVISKALRVIGQIEGTEDIHIDGEVHGDVRGHSIKIGKAAKLKGSVFGQEVETAGMLEGNIEGQKVTLAATAHVSGDPVHQQLKVEAGAFFEGRCKPEFGKAGEKPVHLIKPTAFGREYVAPQHSSGAKPVA